MTLKALRSRLAYWQKRLRLQDWRITIRWAKAGEIPDGKDANIEVVLEHRLARIIMRPIPTTPDPELLEPRCIDEDLAHELLHCYTEPFHRPVDDLAEETMICAIAKALANK